jgi:hypothetical protein
VADNPTVRCVLKFLDATGKKGRSEFWIGTDGSTDPLTTSEFTSVLAVIEPLSTAVIFAALSETSEHVVSGAAIASTWDARDKLVMQFQDSMGRYRLYKLPNPKTTCFVSPALQTMKTSAGPALTLVNTLASNMVDRDGGAFSFIRGYRLRSKRLRPGSKRY